MIDQARIGISLRTIQRNGWKEHLKIVLAGNVFKLILKLRLLSLYWTRNPTFSKLESVATTEPIDANEAIETLRYVTLLSVEEVLADSQSEKEEESEVIDRGSTAGWSHLNWGELRRAERLRRYGGLHYCFIVDFGDGITLSRSNLFALARPADSKGKLLTSLPEDKIFEHENVITWSWFLSNSRDIAISEKVEAYKLSAITIWLAFKNKLNNPN